MSTSVMVADGSCRDGEDDKKLRFDKNQADYSARKIKMHLMKKNRNHLGLEDPPAGGRNLESWRERNDTCVSTIWEACEHDPDVLEVANQYLEGKAILPADDPAKEVLSSELLQTLVDRFRGEIGTVLEKTTAEYHSFKIRPGEKVSVGVDRLNGIIQKLIKLGQPQTEASKLAKIKAALQIEELHDLWMSVAMMPKATTTFDSVKEACEEYDEAMTQLKKLKGDKSEEINFTASKEPVVCSFCRKKGHVAANCYAKERQRKMDKFKRKGKTKEKASKSVQQPGSKDYTGCHICGDFSHKARQCKSKKRKNIKNPDNENPRKSNRKFETEWKKYVNDGESSDDEANMFGEEVLLSVDTSEEPRVYLDSCASKRLFIVKDKIALESFTPEFGAIQLTRKGSQLETQGTGTFGEWRDIRVSEEAVKNIVSGGMLRSMGYGLQLLRKPKIVELDSGNEVLTGEYDEHGGMPYVDLMEVLNLPNVSMCNQMEEVNLSDNTGQDALDRLHERTGHVSKSKLIEAHRHMLFRGSGLQRHHLSKAKEKSCKKPLCKWCAKAKITRHSFKSRDNEELSAVRFLERVTADISVYLNCESRQGYKYVLLFTDLATKMIWEYGLRTRSGEEVFKCLRHLCEVHLVKYEGWNRIVEYHADGGSELISQQIREYLLQRYGTRVSHTTRDTPELNAVSERKFRTIGEMTLTMLTASGLPKSFWFDAYQTACYIVRRMPTRTWQGWMSPYECVPGGSVPSLSWLRKWGCKAYVLTPKADRRKDWEDKAMTGYFIGYPADRKGYKVLVGDTVVHSVHVLFDESVPERSQDYYRELEEAQVAIDPEARQPGEFEYLIGKHHEDGGLLYKTNRVVIRKGLIVGYRSLVTGNQVQVEDKTPIHIADIKKMTEDLAQRVVRARVTDNRDGGISGVVPQQSESGQVQPQADSALPSGEGTPAENHPHGKRARTPRTVTNVSVLGQIHHLSDESDVSDLLQEADSVWMSAEESTVPQTHRESLESAEHREWRRARRVEREGLAKRDTMEVTRIPDGVVPLHSKYVYGKKYDKEGEVRRYKARLVAIGCGQQSSGWANHFAPVVKGVTVRLLIAIAFVMNMVIHQLDVSNAFLYADIEGDVYMKATPDFQLPEGYCFKLKKSLYGLRSSPRSWWKTLDKFIRSMHFKPCVLDPCLYYQYKGDELILLTIYVDDILVLGRDVNIVKDIKAQLCARFDMKDMGEMEHFLNVRVTRTPEYIRLDQSVYAAKILEKFEKYLGSPRKVRKSPLPAEAMDLVAKGARHEHTEEEQLIVDNFPYRPLIGALLYLSMNTRPDIAYAVGVLSRFSNKVNIEVCKLLTHVWQYIRGSIDKGIQYGSRRFDFHMFTDADWAGDQLSRKSTSGYVGFAAGGPIVWQSKLQTTVATSSMQSEYQCIYSGLQEVLWVRGVTGEIKLRLIKPTPFFIDSQSAQDLAENPVFHKKSKHIEIKYHMVREHVDPNQFNTIKLVHVHTSQQAADIYTKSLVGLSYMEQRKRNLGEKVKSSTEVINEGPRDKRRRK